MDQLEIMKQIDNALTMVDVTLQEWQFATDAMSFIIGEANTALSIYVNNIPVKEPKVTINPEPKLHMRFQGEWLPVEEIEDTVEVPLFLGDSNDPNRREIGTAKVHKDGTIDGIVNHEAAGFLALPDPSEYSFFAPELPEPKTKKWWATRVTLPKNLKEIQ